MMGLKDFRIIVKDMGLLLMLISAALMVPAIVSLLYPEDAETLTEFLIPAILSALIGGTCFFAIREVREMGFKDAIAITVLFWPIAALFGAIPLYLTGVSNDFVDCYFEGMSGWTTTGMSIIGINADSFPHSINLWRGMMQFLGGIGVLLISIAVLSQARTGGESISLVTQELAASERIRPSMVGTAKILFILMFAFLLVCSVILALAGMNVFDAIVHAMSGLSTGGFSSHATSIAFFQSPEVEYATVLVMIIGSMNFAIHIAILSGNFKEILKNIETRSFLTLVTLFTIAGAIWIAAAGNISDSYEPLHQSFYHVVSAMTTTGWTIVDAGTIPALFSPFFIFIIIICMVIGGGTASTAGGLKQARVALITKSVWWHLKRALMPSTVVFPRNYHHIIRKTVTDSRMVDIYMFVSIFILTLVASAMVIMAHGGYTFEQSFFEASSALSSGGMSLGVATAAAPIGVKITLMIDMWVGRIEIIPLLMFIVSFSRRFR